MELQTGRVGDAGEAPGSGEVSPGQAPLQGSQLGNNLVDVVSNFDLVSVHVHGLHVNIGIQLWW